MKHNVYYDGFVQSLGVNTDEGYATVGVINAGQFTFSTSSEEHMVIISGKLKYKLPGQEWKTAGQGEKFIAPPGISFDVSADSDVAYLCYYK